MNHCTEPSGRLDAIYQYISERLPRRLVLWCSIRLFAHASIIEPEVDVPELCVLDALRSWDKRYKCEGPTIE